MPAAATAELVTVMSALEAAIAETAAYNKNEQVRPPAILWPDRERQWEKVIPLLRSVMPQLLVLGRYDVEQARGPAIWLKCMVARALPAANWDAETVPVLYLPGVSRAELRAVEECPPELQPLAELQFRGAWFTQRNGKDWTVPAFLVSHEGGLGLEVTRDTTTLDALQHALPQVMRTPMAELGGKQIDQAFLHGLVHADPVRAVLSWLDEESSEAPQNADTKELFRSLCKQKFGFDPDTDGRLTAAERLGNRDGAWGNVWGRFAEAPALYGRIPDLLRSARPTHADNLFFRRDAWPQDNETEEVELRDRLVSLIGKSQAEALKTVADLENAHAARREWVWAQLGQAPLAGALAHLSRLAKAVEKPLSGADRESLALAYRESGWRVDEAALMALDEVDLPADVAAVGAAVRALYLPWLEQSAGRLQQFLAADPLPTRSAGGERSVEEGTCYLFVDGLRYDVAQRLVKVMQSRGWKVQHGWRWAALPTVTATAKPAASPVASRITGDGADAQFTPRVAGSGQELTTDRFRKLLDHEGVAYLGRTETGEPAGSGWTEIDDIDRRGHDEGVRLAHRIDETVREIAGRVATLLDAGWKRIHLLTDHGWLLLPSGLPKVSLPAFLVASRWGRCGVLKETSHTELPTVGWHWNPAVRVVVAPQVGVFYEGCEYAHGGVSLQECVLPEFVVIGASAPVQKATLTSVEWFNLRCRVRVEGDAAGCRVDLRTKPADPKSSLAAPKEVGDDGKVSLLVDDDTLEGCAVIAVLLDPSGNVIAKTNTSVGG